MTSCLLCSFGVFAALLAYPIYLEYMPPKVAEVRGKCAVVTGASAGLGVAIAEELARQGVAKLVIAARSQDKLDAVTARLTKEFPNTQTTAIKADVTKEEDTAALVDEVLKGFGSCPIILVNNAGVEYFLNYENAAKSKIDQMIDLNYRALLHLTRDFLPAMIASGGHIVNIGSLAGSAAAPGFNVYASTKHAVKGFTWNLRVDMRHRNTGVTVHLVAPGFVTDAGMAENLAHASGLPLSGITDVFGRSQPIDTARTVVKVIEHDIPEIIVNAGAVFGTPVRLLAIAQVVWPRFFETLIYLPLPGMSTAVTWLEKAADFQTLS